MNQRVVILFSLLFVHTLPVSCVKSDYLGLSTINGFMESYGYYVGRGDNYSCFTKFSKTKDVYAAFDSLLLYNSDFIIRRCIGKSSDDQDLFCYELGNSERKKRAKIIIICSQHGFEKNSTFGTFFFLRDVLVNSEVDPFLEYVKENVHFIVVPVTNPSGFDAFSYNNSNGVNLNRNWPVYGWLRTDKQPSSNYSGISPLDQPETRAVMEMVRRNLDADLFIDFHTNGMGVIETADHINWISLPPLDHVSQRGAFIGLLNKYIRQITDCLQTLYGNERPILYESSQLGYITIASRYGTTGYCDVSMSQCGLLSLTFEGFNGFPGDVEAFHPDVAKANSELLGNFLLEFCDSFIR